MQYYKDIQNGQKALKTVVKELKVNKVELALESLSDVLALLMKYSSQRFDVTGQAQGMPNSGPGFDQAKS